MVGEDRMETPYGYEEYEEYNWKSLVKRILKYVLIIVVIAVIGWFLYDYFIGSFVDIQISVKDLEGNPVIDNHVTVKSAGSDVLIFEKSGLSVYKQRLRRGNYSIEVEADGYKPYAVERTFNEDNKQAVEKLNKELFEKGFRVEKDVSSSTVQLKIREAELQKIPYIIVIGNKEEKDNTLAVREHGSKKIRYGVKLIDFFKELEEKNNPVKQK